MLHHHDIAIWLLSLRHVMTSSWHHYLTLVPQAYITSSWHHYLTLVPQACITSSWHHYLTLVRQACPRGKGSSLREAKQGCGFECGQWWRGGRGRREVHGRLYQEDCRGGECVCVWVCVCVCVFVCVQYFPSHSSLLLEPEILTSTLTKRRLMKSSPLLPDRREYLFDQWDLSVCVCWEWDGEDVGFFSWKPAADRPLVGLGGQQVEGEGVWWITSLLLNW